MLKSYFLLKGTVFEDLESRIKKTRTQSRSNPNVKVYFNDRFNHPLLKNMENFSDGLFNLESLSEEDRLDYLRSGVDRSVLFFP